MKKKFSLTRREFAGLAATGIGASLAGSTRLAAATPNAGDMPRRGIYRVDRRPKALESPAGFPADEIWRYTLNYPFQVSPTVAGAYLDLKQWCGPGTDFEGGMDVILYDALDGLDPKKAIPITRIDVQANPNNDNKPARMAKYPGVLGFVPLGAKLANGNPHPHAGTGFALITAAAWPMPGEGDFETFPDRIGYTFYRGEKAYAPSELYQFRYDGTRFTVGPRQKLEPGEILPGFNYAANPGMGAAIAEGEDLLTGAQGIAPGESNAACGIVRWRFKPGTGWGPTGFEPISPADTSIEPTLVRDLDGAILFHARGRRHMGPPVRVWRQKAPGDPWELRININGMVPSTPITINRAVDGTPFIAANFYQPQYFLPKGLYADAGVSRLEPVGWRGERSTICIWPLNDSRDGFEAELVARDPRVEFGLPPHGTVWAADHPMASPVRLADNQWHCVMGYRMLEWKENTHFIPPSPQTGSYLDEILSFGPPAPLWNF